MDLPADTGGIRRPTPNAGVNRDSAAPMAPGVGPDERSFLDAVLRHVTLSHDASAAKDELARLEALLASDRSTQRDDRRRHVRRSVDLPAATRRGDTQAPARVLDLGAGGMRLRNEGRLPLAPGDRMVVSLLPEHAPLRIEMPCEVVATLAEHQVGVRFCGPPLVLRGRPAMAAGAAHGTVSMRAAA